MACADVIHEVQESCALNYDIEIEVNCVQSSKIDIELEPRQLSIFPHRFMSIVEQMEYSRELQY
ncbi:Hypothetical protein CINCED_3A008749 [Cinara cedri]|uniref:Uncharacterized protein n=1 Tax=Cinara cedri TaxID=506608 RepID=A0A5E4M5Y6_9HEMI|nr:Hypothetical protein CINCED_3A008749 [Cinara cedri]